MYSALHDSVRVCVLVTLPSWVLWVHSMILARQNHITMHFWEYISVVKVMSICKLRQVDSMTFWMTCAFYISINNTAVPCFMNSDLSMILDAKQTKWEPNQISPWDQRWAWPSPIWFSYTLILLLYVSVISCCSFCLANYCEADVLSQQPLWFLPNLCGKSLAIIFKKFLNWDKIRFKSPNLPNNV